jgi:hypothetical protein
MAISIDWGTKVITVSQSDTDILTLVSGTLYEMDTLAFQQELKGLEDSEDGMAFPDTHEQALENTISGVTYDRAINIINGYSLTFSPNSQWTVLMDGASNNNFHDVGAGILNQNQVQVIPQNSAGNTVTDSSGITPQMESDVADLRKAAFNRVHTDPGTGIMTIYDDDDSTPLKSGNIYEDTSGTQAYRGQGLERRNKLT